MHKEEWTKNFVFLLLGIIVASILSPNAQVQAFLYKYICEQWRIPMGLIILVAAFIGLSIWYWRLQKSSSEKEDVKTQELIEKAVKKALKEDREERRKSKIHKPKE
jgi:uncharacterized integral membrane protein